MARLEWLKPETSIKHWIASDLRFYREKEGWSLAQMGQVIDAAKATVSNIEHARDGWNLNEDQAVRLDRRLGLNDHFVRLVRYARAAHNSDWFGEYLKHEAKAGQLRIFHGQAVPSLFQTEAYMRGLFESAGVVDIDGAVKERLLTQEVLARKGPPLVWVLLDECILHRWVGGRDVMRDQLWHLVRLGELPNVSVRIVPFAEGAYVGVDGSFRIIAGDRYDVVFAGATGGGRLVTDAAEVRRFAVRYDRISAKAASEGISRSMILNMIEVMGT